MPERAKKQKLSCFAFKFLRGLQLPCNEDKGRKLSDLFNVVNGPIQPDELVIDVHQLVLDVFLVR